MVTVRSVKGSARRRVGSAIGASALREAQEQARRERKTRLHRGCFLRALVSSLPEGVTRAFLVYSFHSPDVRAPVRQPL